MIAVAQLGARMHYAVPRILAKHGVLDRLFTDIYASPRTIALLHSLPTWARPKAVRRFLGREVSDLPPDRVSAFPCFGMLYGVAQRMARSDEASFRVHLWAGRTFGRKVARHLGADTRGVYAFTSAALELFEHAQRQRICRILEQPIAPRRFERHLLSREECAYPNWGGSQASESAASLVYALREEAEWKLSDMIICGSEFVRDGIRWCGGPTERCVVVPYGVDVAAQGSGQAVRRFDGKRPLRVLTVGTVGLRKGIQYVHAAAREMGRKVECRIVGPLDIPAQIHSELARVLELAGSVPRSEIGRHFDWADVFLLPSVCEGSATSIYEALAWRLPIICTANCGSVVENGKDGFIIPASSGGAVVNALVRFIESPDLVSKMSHAASETAARHTVNAYGRRLTAALFANSALAV